MTADELFQATGDAYISLIHPRLSEDDFWKKIDQILAVESEASPREIKELINGWSWRERLIGLALAARGKHWEYGEVVCDALLEPKGISLVPSGAFLILSARFLKAHPDSWYSKDFDLETFDGEMKWVLDRVRQHGFEPTMKIPREAGPNYGQYLQDHVGLFSMLPEIKRNSEQDGAQ